MRRLLWIGGAAAAVGAAVAIGSGNAAALISTSPASGPVSHVADTPDAPLTGSDLDKAIQSALAHTSGGTVTETEIGDDGSPYGVEIRKPGGQYVEVNLDNNFVVVGEEADDNDSD